MTEDVCSPIGEIYEAIGDAERWRRLDERLSETSPLSPEIEQHLTIARRAHEQYLGLTREIAILAGMHTQLALSVLIVNRDGLLLRANAAASLLLAERDGLTLVTDRIQATDTNGNAQLQSAIVRAASGGERGALASPFVLLPRRSRQALSILVFPSTGTLRFFEDHRPVALLAIDPDAITVPRGHILQGLFGFTPREAELATLLMQGRSLKDAAAALGVTIATARTFLAHVIAKTDSHSQAELVSRLLAIPRTTPHGV